MSPKEWNEVTDKILDENITQDLIETLRNDAVEPPEISLVSDEKRVILLLDCLNKDDKIGEQCFTWIHNRLELYLK